MIQSSTSTVFPRMSQACSGSQTHSHVSSIPGFRVLRASRIPPSSLSSPVAGDYWHWWVCIGMYAPLSRDSIFVSHEVIGISPRHSCSSLIWSPIFPGIDSHLQPKLPPPCGLKDIFTRCLPQTCSLVCTCITDKRCHLVIMSEVVNISDINVLGGP